VLSGDWYLALESLGGFLLEMAIQKISTASEMFCYCIYKIPLNRMIFSKLG